MLEWREPMIEKLIWMKGQVYSTLTQNKKFKVEDITENRIVIRNAKGNFRPISKKEIEKAWIQLINDKHITQKQIYDMGTQHSAYIVGILAHTLGVTAFVGPARLVYRSPD
jgi:hypothetical protein